MAKFSQRWSSLPNDAYRSYWVYMGFVAIRYYNQSHCQVQ